MLHHRAFTLTDLDVGGTDGRTVVGCAVPFDRPTPITERIGDRLIRYTETFVRGSFDRAAAVPHRVTFVYGHSDSFTERLGHASCFDQSGDRLMVELRLDQSRAEQARDALTSSHGALSIGFTSIDPRPYSERDGANVIRRAVHLFHIAAVPKGAYEDAAVTAIRSDADELAELDADEAERNRVNHVRSLQVVAEIDRLIASQDEWRSRIA